MDIPNHVLQIMDKIDETHSSWIVGGAVRDLLLNETPKDWDLCTTALPEEIEAMFEPHYVKGNNSRDFGTVFVKTKTEIVEVTTLRKDKTKGRHPTVEFTDSLEEDALRRDFTINALYMTKEGFSLDPLDQGFADLHKRNLRFAGNPYEIIDDDPLRLLRAIRFACYGFTWSEDLEKAMMDRDFTLKTLNRLSMERIREELLNMVYASPSFAFQDLYKTGIMEVLLPEQSATWNYDQNTPYHIFKLDVHHIETANWLKDHGADRELVFIGWLHDIGKPVTREDNKHGYSSYIGHDKEGGLMIEQIFRRLKFPTKSIHRAKNLIDNHMVLHQQHKLKNLLKLRDTLQHNNWHLDIVQLYKADLMASRRQESYMEDELPKIRMDWTTGDTMGILEEMVKDYKPFWIGEVQKRVREFYYDFPNIPKQSLRKRVEDFVRSKYL